MQSGSLVHLQLVQVHPGLCEIGSNQEENQTLIQEHQQLMEKLKVQTDRNTHVTLPQVMTSLPVQTLFQPIQSLIGLSDLVKLLPAVYFPFYQINRLHSKLKLMI